MRLPRLQGKILTDEKTLSRYSSDMSGYRVTPRMVTLPEGEEDLSSLLSFVEEEGFSLTGRGAGSNLSGSAVGSGVVVSFSRMKGVIRREGERVTLQPGVAYRRLNEEIASSGFTLRYDVSSGGFSTVGGNVATRAGGLRSIKYGTVDDALEAVRFVSPVFGIVDTRGDLPRDLESGILGMRRDILADADTVALLERRRNLKSSSGYALQAFLDFEDPRTIVTHLLAGSAGTLGLLSEIEMRLVPLPRDRRLITAFYRDIHHAVAGVGDIVALGPSAVEHLDGFGVKLIADLGVDVPGRAEAALLIEFDENVEEKTADLERLLGKTSLFHGTIREESAAEAIWNVRWTMLTRIKRLNEDRNHRYISFIDDMAVPLERLSPFMGEIGTILDDEKMDAIIYGHIGEGNLHMRPLIAREGWRERITRVGERCFAAALDHGGTLTAEHGPGRNRCPYLKDEWGEAVFGYFARVKDLFDPRDNLNPNILFSCEPITAHYGF